MPTAGLTWTKLFCHIAFNPAASCCMKDLAVASGIRRCLRMYSAISPPPQYSITRYMLPLACNQGPLHPPVCEFVSSARAIPQFGSYEYCCRDNKLVSPKVRCSTSPLSASRRVKQSSFLQGRASYRVVLQLRYACSAYLRDLVKLDDVGVADTLENGHFAFQALLQLGAKLVCGYDFHSCTALPVCTRLMSLPHCGKTAGTDDTIQHPALNAAAWEIAGHPCLGDLSPPLSASVP